MLLQLRYNIMVKRLKAIFKGGELLFVMCLLIQHVCVRREAEPGFTKCRAEVLDAPTDIVLVNNPYWPGIRRVTFNSYNVRSIRVEIKEKQHSTWYLFYYKKHQIQEILSMFSWTLFFPL